MSNKEMFENLLFNNSKLVTVSEKRSKAKLSHVTTIRHDGKIVAKREITTTGTSYLFK